MQSRPRAVPIVMGVLLALAVVAVVSAVAEVIKYTDTAGKLTEFQRSVAGSGSQVGLNVEFTHLPAVAIGPTIMVAIVMVAIAAGMVILALALRRPQPRTRVIAFISAGALAVLALAQAGIALTTQMSINQVTDEFQGIQDQLQNELQNLPQNLGSQLPNTGSSILGFEDVFPSWPYYVDYLTSALAIIGCVIIVVQLNGSAAKTWFGVAPTGLSVPLSQPTAGPQVNASSTPVVDIQTILADPWMRSIINELANGQRTLTELQAGPLGTKPEVLNWRLWDLCNAGVVQQFSSPTSVISYGLTQLGKDLRTPTNPTNGPQPAVQPDQPTVNQPGVDQPQPEADESGTNV